MLTIDLIEQAAERLRDVAIETPLLENHHLNAACDSRVLLKPELLQHTGSFKFRGAYNTIAQLDVEQRGRGVVACSSGNHAQGVAYAAQLLDTPATIVMPSDAPTIKIENTKAYGAEVVLYDRATEDRQAIASSIAERSSAELVLPYDDYRVMAGQGTVGLELAAQAKARDIQLDAVIVCCGGGGLSAGVATAFAAKSPETKVYTAEPENFDDHARSFVTGQRESNNQLTGSLCDALMADRPGELTFPINHRLIEKGLVVTEAQVIDTVAFAFEKLKLVVEPGGAAALAAAMNTPELHGLNLGVVLTGGNIDPALFTQVIENSPNPPTSLS